MKELTVKEINNIEDGDYLLKVKWSDGEKEHKVKVERQLIGGKLMAVCNRIKTCWWLGEFTKKDNENWLRVFKC